MAEKVADKKVVTQMEFAISRLEMPSTLPAIAAGFLAMLEESNMPALVQIIESDPASVVRVISLLHKEDVSLSKQNYSIVKGLEKLSLDLIYQTLLNIELKSTKDENEVLPRKQLLIYTLGVACCAKEIAQTIPKDINPQLVYLSGLLHNIGNFALDSAMPKSFERIVQYAKSNKTSICEPQRKFLGLDYMLTGKRLAQRWCLPEDIQKAIWLHRSNADIIDNITDTEIALIVKLAVSIVRQAGIGLSGDFDQPVSANDIAESLGLTDEQIKQIRHELASRVAEKRGLLGLDSPQKTANYYERIGKIAAELAHNNARLIYENHQSQTASNLFGFTADLLANIDSAKSVTDTAKVIALGWQKMFQAAKVCLYLCSAKSELIEAVVVENSGKSKTVLLEGRGEESDGINGFEVLDAEDRCRWLFEQIETTFDVSRCKMVPLFCNGKGKAAVIFEPSVSEQPGEAFAAFKAAASICGKILELATALKQDRQMTERIVQLNEEPIEQVDKVDADKLNVGDSVLDGLCEIAAGAAHELNNPLSTISGRAQLLAQNETDAKKQKILGQIRSNANELAGIIDGLMEYANPQPPKKELITAEQLIDEAIELTKQKNKKENLDIQVDIGQTDIRVFVDSGQVVPAIANIFCNGIESYTDEDGTVKVSASYDQTGAFATLEISDRGCGMDEETVNKATRPFFSARPAGRKRGMGLAHAQRYIKLNGGSIDITSQVGAGTTVTVLLPCK